MSMAHGTRYGTKVVKSETWTTGRQQCDSTTITARIKEGPGCEDHHGQPNAGHPASTMSGALGDERHMLLECPALADLRDEYSPLVAECPVSWLGSYGPETSPWSAGTSLLASIECHADDRQTLFHPFSLVGCQGCCTLSFLPSSTMSCGQHLQAPTCVISGCAGPPIASW